MNALKTGIDAESSVIPGEDPAALAALTERFHQDCQPQSEIESILVDDIVRDTWLLSRLARIDAQLLLYKIEDTNYPSPNAPIGKAFDHSASTQSRLQRRINDTRRLRRESIKELRLIQARRPQPQSQPPAPQPVENETSYQPIGFVTQTHVSEPAPGSPGPAPNLSQRLAQGLAPQPFSRPNGVSGINASAPSICVIPKPVQHAAIFQLR